MFYLLKCLEIRSPLNNIMWQTDEVFCLNQEKLLAERFQKKKFLSLNLLK